MKMKKKYQTPQTLTQMRHDRGIKTRGSVIGHSFSWKKDFNYSPSTLQLLPDVLFQWFPREKQEGFLS